MVSCLWLLVFNQAVWQGSLITRHLISLHPLPSTARVTRVAAARCVRYGAAGMNDDGWTLERERASRQPLDHAPKLLPRAEHDHVKPIDVQLVQHLHDSTRHCSQHPSNIITKPTTDKNTAQAQTVGTISLGPGPWGSSVGRGTVGISASGVIWRSGNG